MWPLALCVLTIGQAPAAPVEPSPIFSGPWSITANDQRGEFTMETSRDNQIHGNMFKGLWTGTFDPKTRRVEFKRRHLKRNGQYEDVQAYQGELTTISDKNPAMYTMKGTFRTIAGPGWGTPGVEYAWRADALVPPDRAEELADLQGDWEVADAQASSGTHHKLPDETHLTRKGEKLTIRGNEMIRDGKLVATLANDLYMPDAGKDAGPARRRPLMLTLPSGKGVLTSYALRDGTIEIVYPHTIGRVGSGQFVWLKRSAK